MVAVLGPYEALPYYIHTVGNMSIILKYGNSTAKNTFSKLSELCNLILHIMLPSKTLLSK
jgi:hypothetical protein